MTELSRSSNKSSTTGSHPLVSIIVPTLNGERFLNRCLESVKRQTYTPIELIVVDNPLTSDRTREIAARYTGKIVVEGRERSAQVNIGVASAKGKYVYKIDCDFELEPTVVAECVAAAEAGADAVVVHNTPDTTVGWIGRVRKFEVDMYKYDITHSSARFVRKDVYEKIGGFNPEVTAGEDYDFQNKLNRGGFKTVFVDAEALHLGEPTKLWPHLRKFYNYGKDFNNYIVHNQDVARKQLAFARPVYLKNWKQFLSHPVIGLEFLGYNLLKYAAGGTGLLVGRLQGIGRVGKL